MNILTLRTACRWALVFASTLFAPGVQAHECRILGQVNDFSSNLPGRYGLCVGFSVEDSSLGQPGEGKKNNLDFFPLFVTGPESEDILPLDTSEGDKVDINATLYYLNDKWFEIPLDDNFNITEPCFFFTTQGVGYESPIARCFPPKHGCKEFKKEIRHFVPVDAEDAVSYRAFQDFILPYSGNYAWIITGSIQKQGQPPVTFKTKWVSAQPRVPYGPADANNIENTLTQAPEGWYDNVMPAAQAAAAARAAAKPARGSPPFRSVLQRAAGG